MPGDVQVDAVHAAVLALLEQPSYAIQAQHVASEIAVMPTPDALVPRLLAATPT